MDSSEEHIVEEGSPKTVDNDEYGLHGSPNTANGDHSNTTNNKNVINIDDPFSSSTRLPSPLPSPPSRHRSSATIAARQASARNKRHKGSNGYRSIASDNGGNGMHGDMGSRKSQKEASKRLLMEASKLSNTSSNGKGNEAGVQLLTGFHDLLISARGARLIKVASPAFLGELLAHLVRLLPHALVSRHCASAFVECLEPFENSGEFVLPGSFYRAIALAQEPPTISVPQGHNWKRKKEIDAPEKTGLQAIREYLCMDGMNRGSDCARRTIFTTLTRALLRMWDGSIVVGRELFNECMVKNRSDNVGLGLEVLVQSLAQEDTAYRAVTMKETAGAQDQEHPGLYSREDDNDNHNGSDDPDDASSPTPSAALRHSHLFPNTKKKKSATSSTETNFPPNKVRDCVTIIGNYVRADADTAAAFFRDILPKVLLMGCIGGDGGVGKICGRVPPRLAVVLRSLADTTRSRSSFNVERMVIHCVKEVKEWIDPTDVLLSMSSEGMSVPNDDDGGPITDDKPGAGDSSARTPTVAPSAHVKSGRGGGNGKDSRCRRGLALACLDILGPTPSCMSLLRRDMVDSETTARLRSAVADAILEYRRTCGRGDADALQSVMLDPLFSLATDSAMGVRMSALVAVGEACSVDSVPGVSLLLERCLDTSAKVRSLAVRLLVDEFRLASGTPLAASLARNILLRPIRSSSSQGHDKLAVIDTTATGMVGRGQRRPGNVPRIEGGGSGGGGGCGAGILQMLLHHHKALEETDKERFPALLKGLVAAVLQGDTTTTIATTTSGDGVNIHNQLFSASHSNIDMGHNEGDSRTSTDGGGEEDGSTLLDNVGAHCSVLDAFDEGISWDALAAPAARLCATTTFNFPSCQATQYYGALDGIIKELFHDHTVRPQI